MGQWLQGKSRCPAPPHTACGWVDGCSVGGSAVPERTPPPPPRACMGPNVCSCLLRVLCCHAVPKHPPHHPQHPHFARLEGNQRIRDPQGSSPSPLPPSLSPGSCLIQFASPQTAPHSLTINKWTWLEAWATICMLNLLPPLPASRAPGTREPRRRCQHPALRAPRRDAKSQRRWCQSREKGTREPHTKSGL